MRQLWKAATVALALPVLAITANAQDLRYNIGRDDLAGAREFSFGGNLSFQSPRFFSINARYGPFINSNVQIGADLGYSDAGGATSTSLGGFLNYHFPGGTPTVPYVGVFLGFTDTSGAGNLTAFGGQAGVKHFISSDVAAFAEYQFRDFSRANVASQSQIVFGLSFFLR
jgi:hypothetical protein